MRRIALLLFIVVAACGGGSSSSTSSSSPQPPAPKGPATAQLSFVGDTGLAGAATKPQVSCNFPTIDGTVLIFVLAQPSDPAVTFNIRLTANKIVVIVATGSGQDFRSRTFEGTGFTGFDAGSGVQIDSPLTETTAADTNRGSLGAITSIKGSVDCGNQTIGTSTVAYTGDTTEGPVNGPPNPFRVECDNNAAQGNSVTFVGVVNVGNTKALFFGSFTSDAINVFESIAGPPLSQHQYVVKAAGVSTLSATGAHVNGDLVEQSPASGAAHTLHIEGDVTCGVTVNR